MIGPNEALPDFKEIAQDIQSRASCCILSKKMEARLFREFFGTSVILWEFLVCDRIRPRGGRSWHLLWALHFMKVYPKQGLGCGAVDPKTHRKWVWAKGHF